MASNDRWTTGGSLETSDDSESLNHWKSLALKHWSKSKRVKKVDPRVIKTEIWDVLQASSFEFRSLLDLDNLQLLEKYLWPGFNDEATNYHVLLIALITTVKSRENLPIWSTFADDSGHFSSFFYRVLALSLDDTLPSHIRKQLLSFFISAFQSLDNSLVRKECAPLVSISIWHHLHKDSARDYKFEQHLPLKKAWRAATRRYEAADDATKSKLRFERSWLYSMMLDFLARLYGLGSDDLTYCERFLEFLTDLESQLPTRRYVNTLIQDLNLLALIRNSPLFNDEENRLLRDLFVLLRHFVYFSIDDNTGTQYTQAQADEKQFAVLARLQRTALKNFKSQLTILALSNYGAIASREELETHLQQLTDPELEDLCKLLDLRTSYPHVAQVKVTRELLMEILVSAHETKKTFRELVRGQTILPTEATLYESTLLRNEFYNGSRSLAIPKLNLQYLSVGDFLWRSFILYRCESFFEIRKSMEDTIKRLRPRIADENNGVLFDGFSRMAIPISKPAIVEVAPPKVGHDQPAFVHAEIALDVSRLAESVRREWESLRPEDVVYLLAVHPTDHPQNANGDVMHVGEYASGLRLLRTAEIVQLLDENGRMIREQQTVQTNGYVGWPRLRKLLVKFDAVAYKSDCAAKNSGKPDVYESINIIMRRKGRENNFKRILETMQSLALADVPLPSWLREVFLGYGDPASASYTRLESRIKTVDYRDTFLNWEHLVESLPGKTIEPDTNMNGVFGPPYILETSLDPLATTAKTKKRRRDVVDPVQHQAGSFKVSTYHPPLNGPYPSDAPKTNSVRFTPAQVDAIMSGTQPGLTVIVGPPGTGKTDVATQIINNIYHDFPSQRTLLIAHSNQALNQLFQKIINLDIDERHLLRLGHGEEELETNANFGKYGRVESFLENRARYLVEVDRLAKNFGAPGAHGNSCETAGYFNAVYVVPAWKKFWGFANQDTSDVGAIVSSFPFHHYFSNAPQPLFPSGAAKGTVLVIAKGCERHIDRIFGELKDILPFEVLRSSKDKTNYLMIKEARIIAMTSTHAAMRRQEISDLGFHYDNVIMEEAAQITEIETFIPLALQRPKDGVSPLQRVVLCGDHLQNSPIIQNLAFRQFANLEQSLFLRLVRLGVPTINLDRQGRARSSIAELYKWRYPKLDDLPGVLTEPEFLRANAGFKYDYQFIDVSDYKGSGESQPSPHFFQNLGEAEYAVAIYQYMRLLGYPAAKISILTTYAGQRALIRDVLGHRCLKNRLFGLPRIVTTVDKYQGEQNDYVILSLTRTSRVGYLRDIRRLTVALSRARLGLYILGRRAVFESCYELRQAFQLLFRREDKLQLVTGEVHPTGRQLEQTKPEDVPGITEMVGVEHLGQYVFEMTQAKTEALKKGESVVTGAELDQNMSWAGYDDDEAAPPEEEEDEAMRIEEIADGNVAVDVDGG
ncbi:hypothetical protein MMC07_005359 [Pseudocyphellaria aurata]|nr:hypothetical protein [Pseudocyphellaria aurata]